jgi:septal ring factor EnvC (AmiA/AmiB activator)
LAEKLANSIMVCQCLRADFSTSVTASELDLDGSNRMWTCLRGQVKMSRGRFSVTTADITALQAELSVATANITALQAEFSVATANITALQAGIAHAKINTWTPSLS